MKNSRFYLPLVLIIAIASACTSQTASDSNETAVGCKLGDAVEGASLAAPCVKKTSLYMKDAIKRWQQKNIYWRTMTGYDATQAFIGAINKSSNEPTRSEILKNLKTLTLPVEKTSGYGLNWSKEDDYLYQSNINSLYCMYKIENGQFKEVFVNYFIKYK